MRAVAAICVIAASALLGSPVRAELHSDADHDLDQSQVGQDYGYGVGGETMMAQTFTVGLPGQLCHVQIGNTTGLYWGDASLEASPPVVEIWSTTTDGSPGSVIGSVPLDDPVPLNDWTPSIDFMPYNIWVQPGDVYSIVVYADDYTGAVSVGAIETAPDEEGNPTHLDPYGGGELWAWGIWDDEGLGPETWGRLSLTGVYYMQFQTYVLPVPLPAGVWLGICAVGVAGWHLKRQTA